MRGERLFIAQHIADRTFLSIQGFSPRNQNQPTKRFYSYWWSDDEKNRILGIYRKTRARCSCRSCRGYKRDTIKTSEARLQMAANYQCIEAGVTCREKIKRYIY